MEKTGSCRTGFFSTVNYYDANGRKNRECRPGFFGGWNHYDE